MRLELSSIWRARLRELSRQELECRAMREAIDFLLMKIGNRRTEYLAQIIQEEGYDPSARWVAEFEEGEIVALKLVGEDESEHE